MATPPSVQVPKLLSAWSRFVVTINRTIPSYSSRTASARVKLTGTTTRRGGV